MEKNVAKIVVGVVAGLAAAGLGSALIVFAVRGRRNKIA